MISGKLKSPAMIQGDLEEIDSIKMKNMETIVRTSIRRNVNNTDYKGSGKYNLNQYKFKVRWGRESVGRE